jgi:hypothetical protein
MSLCLPPLHLPCPVPWPHALSLLCVCLPPGRRLCWSCRVRAIANCGVLSRALLSCPCIPVLLCLRSCARVCSCAFCWAEVDRESTPSAKLKALCNSARVCLGAFYFSLCNSSRVCLGALCFVSHSVSLQGYVRDLCLHAWSGRVVYVAVSQECVSLSTWHATATFTCSFVRLCAPACSLLVRPSSTALPWRSTPR